MKFARFAKHSVLECSAGRCSADKQFDSTTYGCVCVCVSRTYYSYVSCTPSWLASAGSLEFVYSYCIRESICVRYNTTWWVSHASYWPPHCHLEAQIVLCTVLVLSTCTIESTVTIQLRNLHMKCAMCFVGFGRLDHQLSSYASLTDWPFVRKVHLVFGSNPSKDTLCTHAEAC